jgi:4-amino-4-deoxy-L-arabinose transferase-like glycosyltransferase
VNPVNSPAELSEKNTRIVLFILFFISIVVKIFFVFATPLYMDEAEGRIRPLNDEYPHFKYSRYLIEHREFPVNRRNLSLEDPAAWIFLDFEYGQAPLAYTMYAPFTLLPDPIRTSRLLSVAISSATLWIAVLCIPKVLRRSRLAAITGMVLLGFNPVLVRIGSSISNDNLTWLVSITIFYLYLKDPDLQKKWIWGILIALGVLSKVSFLIWPVFLFLRMLLYHREKKHFLRFTTIAAIAVILSGWWFVRSHMIYGDWTGIAGGAGPPGNYLRSASLYLIQDFADSVVRLTFFPIAEESPKYLFITQFFIVLILTSCFLQFRSIRELFFERSVFRDFLLFDALNGIAFLYPNLFWPYADGRLLFIGLLPMAAIIVAALLQNLRKYAPVLAMLPNLPYLLSLW